MGGSDYSDETGKVLEGINKSGLHFERIDVVVGSSYKYLESLKEKMMKMEGSTLHVQTDKMAGLMCMADLAITSGGTVTWEKCCLGLPSITVMMADNQREISAYLASKDAQINLGSFDDVTSNDYADCISQITKNDLIRMSSQSRKITDGRGVNRVIEKLT